MEKIQDFEIENGVLEKYIGKGGAVVVPNDVTVIGGGAFSDCTKLKRVIIPHSVTEIGECAFNYCKSLKSITIPDGVKTIAGYAFQFCENLKSIELPASLESVGEGIFRYCEKLIIIKFAGTEEQWKKVFKTSNLGEHFSEKCKLKCCFG